MGIQNNQTPDYFLSDGYEYDAYKIFFKNCPILNELFVIGEGKVVFSSNLSETERHEIREYIHTNFVLKVRVRFKDGKVDYRKY